jgi:putative spermidine/putrescine transport system ATP-binding protein
MSQNAPPALRLVQLRKNFGSLAAVADISLTVEQGEFVSLLGPSGSGKTTTLRMIAGFTTPTTGEILTNGTDITHYPPSRRSVGMVFQNYALFPHLTAAQNVAFPLEMRKVKRPEIRRRVDEALNVVDLLGLGDRKPRELSGGQQQRVALARAFVYEPAILLMDEPLGALDKKLRESLQFEIVRIAREINATVVYVTHDQGEALTMSDRIAVFHRGQIEQIGSPAALYERPTTRFVADFLGESTMIDGRASPASSRYQRFEADGFQCAVPAATESLASGGDATLVLRPEQLELSSESEADPKWNVLEGVVVDSVYAGATRRYTVRVGNVQFVVREPAPRQPRSVGDRVVLRWHRDMGSLVGQ